MTQFSDGSTGFQNPLSSGATVIKQTGQGIFVYSGTPTLGNLIVAITATAGTDPYGNTFKAGVTIENSGLLEIDGSNGRYIKGYNSSGISTIEFRPENNGSAVYIPGFLRAKLGGVNEPGLVLDSGYDDQAVNNDHAALTLYGGNNVNDFSQAFLEADSIVLSTGFPGASLELDDASGGVFANGWDLTDSWTSFTPTWTASTTNPSLGNGTVQAAYKQVGSIGYFRVRYTFGSTTNFGAGAWQFGMPFDFVESGTVGVFCHDSSATQRVPAVGYMDGTSVVRMATYAGALNAGVSATNPFTWANGDQLLFGGSAEVVG